MGASENAALLRKGYEAFGKGDLDALRSLMAPNAVWHIAGAGPLAGDYEGLDAIFGLFGRIFELSGGTFKFDIHDVCASDEHVVGLVRATGQRGDVSLDANAVHVYHVMDGKVTEFWEFDEDQDAADAFFA